MKKEALEAAEENMSRTVCPTVSIIIPVFNAEKTIRRCVDSVLNQEYKEFELILMDDGSKDSSGRICDEYAETDSRVFVIHKENSGVSDTRNRAIDLAKGKYLQFLDSDDWITPDATRLLVRSAQEKNCDLVIADFYRVVGERISRKGDIEADSVMNREEFAEHMMENPADFYYGVLWNKLYRRDIVEENHIRMNADIRWCEDFLFNLEYILRAEAFCALQVPIYYYVKTEGALVSQSAGITKAVRMKLMVFESYNEFFKNVYDEEEYQKKRLQVYRFFLEGAGDGAVRPALIPGGKKLGSERSAIDRAAVDGEGILMDDYRRRKLLDHYLEVVALEANLSLTEVRLLWHLNQPHHASNRRELADFADMAYGVLARNLHLLVVKGLVKITEIRDNKKERRMDIQLTEASAPVLSRISVALGNRFRRFLLYDGSGISQA